MFFRRAIHEEAIDIPGFGGGGPSLRGKGDALHETRRQAVQRPNLSRLHTHYLLKKSARAMQRVLPQMVRKKWASHPRCWSSGWSWHTWTNSSPQTRASTHYWTCWETACAQWRHPPKSFAPTHTSHGPAKRCLASACPHHGIYLPTLLCLVVCLRNNSRQQPLASYVVRHSWCPAVPTGRIKRSKRAKLRTQTHAPADWYLLFIHAYSFVSIYKWIRIYVDPEPDLYNDPTEVDTTSLPWQQL